MFLYILLSYVAGITTVILVELQGLESLLAPYRGLLSFFFGLGG